MKKIKLRLPKTGAIYAIVLFVIIYSFLLNGQYLTVNNIINVLHQSSTLCILSISAFLAILTHQIDLSLGSIVSLSGVVLGLLLNSGVPLPLAILGAVLSGTAIGAINGVIAGYTTIPPFIVTLATMNIASSIALVLNNGTLSVSHGVLQAFNTGRLLVFQFRLWLLFSWLSSSSGY